LVVNIGIAESPAEMAAEPSLLRNSNKLNAM